MGVSLVFQQVGRVAAEACAYHIFVIHYWLVVQPKMFVARSDLPTCCPVVKAAALFRAVQQQICNQGCKRNRERLHLRVDGAT